jgi:F0F1-type ATP synthase assembly protein I
VPLLARPAVPCWPSSRLNKPAVAHDIRIHQIDRVVQMRDEQPDDRSSLAAAYQLSALITATCFEFVLPALGGYWLDRRWGTLPLFLVLGIAVGAVAATLSLVRLLKSLPSNSPRDRKTPPR